MRQGQTLLETIIACFLLLACFLVIISLFHSGLRYTSQIENQQLAAMLAERYVEQMRAWSESPAGNVYNYDNLASIYSNQTVASPDYPGFSITTNVTAHYLYSSCSAFEQDSAALGQQARRLNNSAKNIDVGVIWDGGRRRFAVSTLFSRPASTFSTTQAVKVDFTTAPALPLAQDATCSLKATGYDVNNQPIDDLFFTWSVYSDSSSGGSGTVEAARDGRTALFTHLVYSADGTKQHVTGGVYMQATAKYHGKTVSGQSTKVTLQ